MNLLFILILAIPLVEIFLLIEIGQYIGALNTILLIIFTAITGVYYAKLEGLNTLKSGMSQLIQNQIPTYEFMSGAALAIAAFLLILPGFLTDIIGFLLIIPITRKFFIKMISSKFNKKNVNSEDIIEGNFEDSEQKDKD